MDKNIGKKNKKIHLKDFRRKIGNLNGFVDLLAGDVNFPQIIDNLKSINYDDYLIAEVSPYHYYSEQVIYNTALAIDRILKDNN